MIKKITLLCLPALALNVQAYEGKNFKIISEEYKETPNFNGSIVPNDNSKKTMSTEAEVYTQDAKGKVKEYVKIQSLHSVKLRNETNENKRYEYIFTLKSEDAMNTFKRSIEIFPRGDFRDTSYNYGTVQKQIEGNYKISAFTKITCAENDEKEANALLKISK